MLCYGRTWGWQWDGTFAYSTDEEEKQQAVALNSNSCFVGFLKAKVRGSRRTDVPLKFGSFQVLVFLSGLFYDGDTYPALLSRTRMAWDLLFAMAEHTSWFQTDKNLGHLCSCRLMKKAGRRGELPL